MHPLLPPHILRFSHMPELNIGKTPSRGLDPKSLTPIQTFMDCIQQAKRGERVGQS